MHAGGSLPIPSLPIPLGSRLPWFDLVSLDGDRLTTRILHGRRPDEARLIPVLVVFLCNHSPYVRHIEAALATLAERYLDRVAMLAIASNNVRSYPSDSPDMLAEQAKRTGFKFPYYLDAEQRSAKAFRASCTPEFFVYDQEWRLAYHGQFDSSRPDNTTKPTGVDVDLALEYVLDPRLKDMNRDQHPSLGCSIKWTPGNEPSYIISGANTHPRTLG
jgi:hypothetical protein